MLAAVMHPFTSGHSTDEKTHETIIFGQQMKFIKNLKNVPFAQNYLEP
jgi:hypothetical protein